MVITEAKSEKIEDTSAFNKEDAAFISAHFEARQKSEEEFFGHYKNFPPQLPLLRIPHGGINSELVGNIIDFLSPDLILLFGTSILKDPLLKKYPNRVINLHLGLSPYFKGSATNLFPYLQKQPECIGATFHLAIPKVDEGAILHQFRPELEAEDDLHIIGNKVIKKAGGVLPAVVKAYSENKIIPQKQSSHGRLCRIQDLTPSLLWEIYREFEKGQIGDYLKDKERRDAGKPIVENQSRES